MGDRIATVATTIITAVTAVVIVTNPRTAGFVRALGGSFIGALRTIARAGGR